MDTVVEVGTSQVAGVDDDGERTRYMNHMSQILNSKVQKLVQTISNHVSQNIFLRLLRLSKFIRSTEI